MSSTSIDNYNYNGNAHNNNSNNRDREGWHNYKRNNRRKSYERQPSDKHLKRRAQIKHQQQLQTNDGVSNGRLFLSHDPLATIGSSSSSYHSHEQYDRNTCCSDTSRGGGLLSRYCYYKGRRKISTPVLLVSVLLILVVALFKIGYSTLVFSTTVKATTPGIIMGGTTNNDSTIRGDSDSGDNLRSYKDLADSIRSLRKRRQSQRDEAIVVVGDGQGMTDDLDEENQLKRLEQKIQRDQTEKVRQEILLSNQDDNNPNDPAAAASSNGRMERNRGREFKHHQQTGYRRDEDIDDIALKNRDMSEHIAELKLLNERKNQKGG